MKTEKDAHKSGRTKDVVRGFSWRMVSEGETFPDMGGVAPYQSYGREGVAEHDSLCVPDVCLPGFDKEKLKEARKKGYTGFFYVTDMSDAMSSISLRVGADARARKMVPVFFRVSFSVKVDKYVKSDVMDWDNLTYLQAYQLYKEHLSAIWSRVAASGAEGRDEVLKYSNIQDALADDPLLAITTLWQVFPTLQAVAWDLPIDAVPRLRGLAIRNAESVSGITVLAPIFGNLPGEWRLCDPSRGMAQAEISDWPQL